MTEMDSLVFQKDNSHDISMPRPARDEALGAVHHVVPQGNGRQPIVEDDRDRHAFVQRFARVGKEVGWVPVADCLLDTHHHAVVETQANLGAGMRRILGGHARWFNARHDRHGSVFAPHFWSRRVFDDGWLLRACIYIVVNPVAAGLCGHPRDWRWCSYRATACGDPDVYAPGEERLLRMFGDTPREARQRYVEVVDEAVEIVRERRLASGGAVWRALNDVQLPQAGCTRELQLSD